MDNKARKTFRLILFIVGAAMIALGVGLTLRLMIADSERQDLKNKYIETEAFVDSVDSKINMYSEGPDKIVMAHYTVDGKLYDNVQIFDYPATISEGDIITVYYDPADPGIIIKNPDRGTSLVANIIGLILIVLGFAAIIFGGKASKGRADMKLEERYHPHDNYTGEMTERANTLFDREVSPKEFTPDQDYSKKW